MGTATAVLDLCGQRHRERYPASMVKRVLRGVQDIRVQMGDVFKAIEERKEHVVLARRGKTIAVLVDIDWYRKAAKAMEDPTEY